MGERCGRSGESHASGMTGEDCAGQGQVPAPFVEGGEVGAADVRAVAQSYDGAVTQRSCERSIGLAGSQHLGPAEHAAVELEEAAGKVHGTQRRARTTGLAGCAQVRSRAVPSSTAPVAARSVATASTQHANLALSTADSSC